MKCLHYIISFLILEKISLFFTKYNIITRKMKIVDTRSWKAQYRRNNTEKEKEKNFYF